MIAAVTSRMAETAAVAEDAAGVIVDVVDAVTAAEAAIADGAARAAEGTETFLAADLRGFTPISQSESKPSTTERK